MDVRDILTVTPKSSGHKRTIRQPPPPSALLQKTEELTKRSKRMRLPAESDGDKTFITPSEVGIKSATWNKDNGGPSSSTSRLNGVGQLGDLDAQNPVDISTIGESEVTESTVRRMALLLEKRMLTNQEARTKFPDQPTKFMESEVELQETLEGLQILAANPSLYHVLASQTRSIQLLLSLLSHENTDVSINVIDLLHQLLDPSGLREAGAEAVNPLLQVLFTNQFIQLLAQNLGRLDESVRDEAEGVHNTLGIVESLLDVRPDMAVKISQQGIFPWLLRRVQRRGFDANKLYVSEVLAILLQLEDANKAQLGEMDGIDILLQQLSTYKRHDPANREEAEMMYNLFDCLCSSLLLSANKDRFLKDEGIQLMNLMLRAKHAARDSALRVLDFAMSVVSSASGADASSEGDSEEVDHPFLSEGEASAAANCNKFVEVFGLRTIFPLFMHSPKARGDKLAATINEASLPGPTSVQMEEHIVSIVSALLQHCTGQYKARVMAKYVENQHEKVDRLIELHFSYLAKVKRVDSKMAAFREKSKRRSDITPEEVEEAISMKRLESGSLSLQLIDVSILDLCVNGQPSIRECIFRLLKMKKSSPTVIMRIAQEYMENLGTEKNKKSNERSRVHELLRRMGTLIS